MSTVTTMLKPVASLRLTVVLLSLSMVLILAGTLAQTGAGVWTVVDEYFRSVYVLIPFQLFVPVKIARIPGVMPFPGGLTLGVLMFVNLVAAHAVRFSLTWKRSGMIITHAGVMLLLAGEFVTGAFAREGTMSIDEGSSSNYVEDMRTSELAVVNTSDPKDDLVVVIPERLLSSGGKTPISHGMLPFDVRVVEWMPNSRLMGPMQGGGGRAARATAGTGRQVTAVAAPPATGVDGATIDVPAAYVALSSGGKELGTYLVSPNLRDPQAVDAGGTRYWIELRFARTYKPYTVHLIDFKHDRFVGTETPRNFSSLVRLVDPTRHVDREVLISMNNPLRYAGETFYQSAFKPDDSGTVLQAVANPGWLIPYASCTMVTIGLLIHFGIRLSATVRRKIA